MNSIILKIAKLDKYYKLFFSIVFSLVTLFLIPKGFSYSIVFMMIWIAFAICNLFFGWITILSLNAKETGIEVKGTKVLISPVFIAILFSSFISLLAIIILIKDLPQIHKYGIGITLFIPFIAVTCSWLLIHTIFTLWYAHIYYSYQIIDHKEKNKHHKGLEFPGDEEPEFSDFAYFSFVLGMTFQVSDVQITSTRIRRMALLHGLLSFIYNTVIVAISINLISGLLQQNS